MTDTAAARLVLGPLETVAEDLPARDRGRRRGRPAVLPQPGRRATAPLPREHLLGRTLASALPGAKLSWISSRRPAGRVGRPAGRAATAAPAGGCRWRRSGPATCCSCASGRPTGGRHARSDSPDAAGTGIAEPYDRRPTASGCGYLAEVTETMIGTLDTGEATTRLAELVVSRLCDWAIVVVRGDDGSPADEGRAHRDPARLADVNTYRDRRSGQHDPDSPMVTALLTGKPVQLPSIDADRIAPTLTSEEVRAAWERLDTTSATIVPLRARGKTFGALALMNAGRRPPPPAPRWPRRWRSPAEVRWRWTTPGSTAGSSISP